MKYNAVILAGAQDTELTSENAENNYEAMIEISQKPMIIYILQALTKAEKINKIIIIGPKKEEEFLKLHGADLVLEGKKSIVKNIKLGLQALSQFHSKLRHFLLASSDIPLTTATAIDNFLNKCEGVRQEYGLYYPIIPKETNLNMYPESERTYVKLKEGTYTGGNLALLDSKIIKKSSVLINKIINNRKNPFKMSQFLGLKLAIKLLCHRLTITEVENRVSQLIDDTCKAIITDYPELGFDIDKRGDLNLIQKLVSK